MSVARTYITEGEGGVVSRDDGSRVGGGGGCKRKVSREYEWLGPMASTNITDVPADGKKVVSVIVCGLYTWNLSKMG